MKEILRSFNFKLFAYDENFVNPSCIINGTMVDDYKSEKSSNIRFIMQCNSRKSNDEKIRLNTSKYLNNNWIDVKDNDTTLFKLLVNCCNNICNYLYCHYFVNSSKSQQGEIQEIYLIST